MKKKLFVCFILLLLLLIPVKSNAEDIKMKKKVVPFWKVNFFTMAETMEKCMSSWKGYSLNELISIWGYPKEEKIIAGKKLYYWYSSEQVYHPPQTHTYGTVNYDGTYNSNSTTYGGYTSTYYCNLIIGVDKKNKVNYWEWDGNSCPRGYKRGKLLINPKNDLLAKEIEKRKKERQIYKEERKAKRQALKAEKEVKAELKKKEKELK